MTTTKLQAYAGAHEPRRSAPKRKVQARPAGHPTALAVYSVADIQANAPYLSRNHVAILLASLDGDYSSMSEALRIPTGTCKSRLHRARAYLNIFMQAEKQAAAGAISQAQLMTILKCPRTRKPRGPNKKPQAKTEIELLSPDQAGAA